MKKHARNYIQKSGKALFLYSDATGIGTVNRHLKEVVARLSARFETLDVCQTASMEDGIEKAVGACGVYDVLVFSGGDGTFNHLVNALVGKPKTPILGYINGGTVCDIGKNFGIHGSFRRALRIIEEGYTCGFDVGRINDDYFTYVAAIGAFAEIPYAVERKYKKHLGRIAYYFRAIGDALVPKKIDCHVIADGKEYRLKVPFVLCLSGKNVGGFPVNSRKSSIHDGKFELYLTKPGIFNGLLHYLFFKARTVKIVASEFEIDLQYPLPWDLDGEKGPSGKVKIKALDSGLKIFCAPKYVEK